MQVQAVCQLVAVRGARLTAAAIAGMLRHLGRDDRSSPDAPKNVVAVEGAVLRKCASPFPYPFQFGSELYSCPWRDATAAGPDAPGTWSLLRLPSCASEPLFEEQSGRAAVSAHNTPPAPAHAQPVFAVEGASLQKSAPL